jgi:hypothetical protein
MAVLPLCGAGFFRTDIIRPHFLALGRRQVVSGRAARENLSLLCREEKGTRRPFPNATPRPCTVKTETTALDAARMPQDEHSNLNFGGVRRATVLGRFFPYPLMGDTETRH